VGTADGRGKLVGALTESVGQACTRAGLEFATVCFEAACFGMSGGPQDKADIISETLRIGRLVTTDDAVIALAGATAGEPGIITIAGTGSIAFGRDAAERGVRVGGWGYIFGDEGAGFDIARQALRAALRWEEGWGQQTSLHAILLDAAGTRSANETMHLFYTDEWPRSRVARLARLVDRAAMEGDLVAREILLAAGQQLAMLAASVRQQLWRPGEPVRLAYIGGVFRSALLLERFRLLVEMDEGNRCGPPVYGPAAGALLEAYRAAGLRPNLSNVPELKSS
jgi:N-acetylglucosamine kinase-like BadF-type ATPase